MLDTNQRKEYEEIQPEMDLSIILREKKLEEIRVFLTKQCPNGEETRDTALNLVVESFYSQYFTQIVEANKI